MKIKQSILTQMGGNNKLVAKLMIAFDKGERTIQLWIENNSEKLTMAAALKIISEEIGVPESEILNESVPA